MTDIISPGENQAARALATLAGYIEHQLAPLQRIAETLAGIFGSADTVHLIDEAVLTPAVQPIKSSLAGATDLIGLGYSAARGVLRDNDSYLLWYQKGLAGIRRLVLNLDDTDFDFYDYHDTEWFCGARELRKPSIYGPYLDYAGADRLVYTFAVPILAGERFVGVAGADLDAAVVERRFAHVVGQLDRPAIVITRDRVVIAEMRTPWLPGERIPQHSLFDGDWQTVGQITEWTGWHLAVAPPPTP